VFKLIKSSKRVIFCITLINLFIFIGLISIAQANESDHSIHHWGYEGGEGPAHWGEMEQDHEKHLMCREGVRQSPINFEKAPELKMDGLHIEYSKSPVNLINNTHTVLLKYQKGSFVVWEGEKFELLQIHFHHPSEHTVNGEAFPMEIHFVHRSGDHEYVVIGVFAKYGKFNNIIKKLWKDIPTEINKETLVKDHLIDAGALFPSSMEYFLYNGSLTTPPCSENVTWFVLEEPIEVSEKQVKYFQRYIDHNARPVQEQHHRIVVKHK
jgi:carbonic anhydrase